MSNCFGCSHHNELVQLRNRIARFESGDEYMRQELCYQKEIHSLSAKNSKLEKERDRYHALFTSYEDKFRSAEHELGIAQSHQEELEATICAKDQEIVRLNSVIEELKGTIQQLKAQLNRDYTNSSIPSSKDENHKKISNNRERTTRKPGGQAGHRGSSLKPLPPTKPPVYLPAPDEITHNPAYYKTGRIIRRQIIELSVDVSVTEYYTDEYRCRSNGNRYHAPFPAGAKNAVNYGPNVKAAAFLLNNYCNVSIDKTQEFLRELTDGKLCLSKGMLNGLAKTFSQNTADERRALFSRLQAAPCLYSDATVGRVNGKNDAVIVCATPAEVLYFARDKKGKEGLKDTPVDGYQFSLIHDHDVTYYNYGSSHQECLAHVLRYLQNSIENEPKLTWNGKMKALLSCMIHTAKCSDRKLTQELKAAFSEEYDAILELAEKEYALHPPSKYYKDGFNLFRRMKKYKESHLLFLSMPEVEYTNNLSERLLRGYKRKQRQAVSFRSKQSQRYLCDALSIIKTAQLRQENILQTVKSYM